MLFYQTSHSYDLAPDENLVLGSLPNTQSHVCPARWTCVYSMCGVFVCVLRTLVRDKQSDTQRLPSPATHAHVGPACGHKAVFAEALERSGGVHTAGVLARAVTSPGLCTLINVYTAGAGVVQPKA